MVLIRPATTDDAAGWSAVEAEASPYLVQDAGSTAHEMRTEPADARRLVAVDVSGPGDRVVGIGRVRAYDDEDHCSLKVSVRTGDRRRGVGRALYDALQPLAAATGRATLQAIVEDDEGSRIASERWGFGLTRTFRMSAVDPRALPAPAPDDRVCALDTRDPREVWQLFNTVVGDDPSGLSLATPWEEWLDDWEDPRNRPALSRGVLVEGALAAFSVLGAAGPRAWSNMTGTHPDHRGHGLALLAKRHTLHAAARDGIEVCFAGNDGDNLPMVAVNTRLGYRPFAAPRLAERPLR